MRAPKKLEFTLVKLNTFYSAVRTGGWGLFLHIHFVNFLTFKFYLKFSDCDYQIDPEENGPTEPLSEEL